MAVTMATEDSSSGTASPVSNDIIIVCEVYLRSFCSVHQEVVDLLVK